jgi:hypothetical protein
MARWCSGQGRKKMEKEMKVEMYFIKSSQKEVVWSGK